MATRRVIKSLLHNFLGTLASRYSQWHGYWLFGFLVNELNETVEYDLLTTLAELPDQTPAAHIRSLATKKFLEQLSKAGLHPTWLREATLTIERLSGSVEVQVDSHTTAGYRMRFIVSAITDLGRAYKCELIVAVAPHNPAHERQSKTCD